MKKEHITSHLFCSLHFMFVCCFNDRNIIFSHQCNINQSGKVFRRRHKITTEQKKLDYNTDTCIYWSWKWNTEVDSDLDMLTFLVFGPPDLPDECWSFCVSPHEGSTALKNECWCLGDRGVAGGQQSWKRSTHARRTMAASVSQRWTVQLVDQRISAVFHLEWRRVLQWA